MQRRALLKGIGGATVGGLLAGCLGNADDDPDQAPGSSGDGDDGGDSGESDSREVVSQSIETLSTSGDNTANTNTVSNDGDVVTVQGTITASTPCHVATLETVSYDAAADELAVTVGTEDDSEEGEACQQMIAGLEYEAEIEFSGGAPADGNVQVTHNGTGGDGDY